MQKNPLFFTMWGMAKATDTPVLVRENRIARKWEESQGRCVEGEKAVTERKMEEICLRIGGLSTGKMLF
ncbi:MAG: hypothetical protein V8Q91_10085 [Bilophila wadsworthia]|uniref:hypothetical protein n=1 Tax=Bilophila wadsworthia TaxID=35833 RepID=UPI00300F4A14